MKQLIIHGLSLSFNKLDVKSERIKERIKVSIHGEALNFDNIDNPLSFLLIITFSSVRPRSRFQVVVNKVGYSFINYFI